MSMKARKIRQRSVTLADDDVQDESAAEAVRKSVAARKQQKDKKGSQKPQLSFDDDEEIHFAPVKRPPAKLKPDLKGLKLASDSAKTSTQRSAPGDYSAEKLLELQRNTNRLPPSKPATDTSQATAQPAFKLSGSFKKAGAGAAAPEAAKGAAHIPRDPDDEMPLPAPARPSSRPPLPPSAPAHAGTRGMPGAEEGPGFEAPDADTIRKIKERRARLQHAHLAPDYIPVAGGGMDTLRDSAKAEPGSGSDSEPEAGDQLRMTFLGDTKKRGKATPGVFAQVAEDAQAPDDDVDDDDRWIEEQIKKGTAGSADPAAVAAVRSAAAAAAVSAAAAPSGAYARQLDGMAAAPSSTSLWQQQPEQLLRAGQDVMLTLQQGVAQLQASHSNAQKQLQRTSQNLADSITSIDTFEEQLQSAGTRYTFLQETKAYIADLCDMLQAKSPIVEELQDHMTGLQRHRGQVASDNSTGNDREEMAPAEAAVQAALGVLSRGGAEPAAAAAAERAADSAEADLLSNLPEKLDEFGRDENVELREEMSRRAHKRQNQYRSVPAQPQGAAEERWGDATTDESDSEVTHYRSKRAEALEASASVFADASEEYGSLAAVKHRLEQWKQQQPGAYADAYMSLTVPAVMAPFVRLELLQWDPLLGGSAGFDSQSWYKHLFEYGLNGDPSTSGNGSDPDEELIPRLVTQLVLPLAAHSLQHAWNPFSRRSTAAAKAMLEDLLIYVPPEEAKLQDLLYTVRQRLERAVASTRLPPWPAAATATSRRATIFLARRFGKALRLLHSVLAFDGFLPRRSVSLPTLHKLHVIASNFLITLPCAYGSEDLLCRLSSCKGSPALAGKPVTSLFCCHAVMQSWWTCLGVQLLCIATTCN
ncbi:hypothetical protein ABBQ38_000395 [Trebouxia sp. C0009 RCD-2024]